FSQPSRSTMGNKHKKKKHSANNNNNHDAAGSSSSRNSISAPRPFEMVAENRPSTSNGSEDDPVRAKHLQIFPWSSLRTSNRTPEEKLEEVQFRLGAASIHAETNIVKLLPMLRKISKLRDLVGPTQPLMPSLLLAALTCRAGKEAWGSGFMMKRPGLLDMPPHILVKIYESATDMKSMRTTCLQLLNALTDDPDMELVDGNPYFELSKIATVSHYMLNRKKNRLTGVFGTNWFRLNEDGFKSMNVLLVENRTTVGCLDPNMPFYLVRRREVDVSHWAEIRWWTHLGSKALPLWLFNSIKTTAVCTFKASYEPGDSIIMARFFMMTRTKCVLMGDNSVPTFKRIGQHVRQYELSYTIPPPQMESEGRIIPLDLCLSIPFNLERDNLVVWDVDVRFYLPDRMSMIEQVARYQEKMDIDRAQSSAANIKTLFPSDLFHLKAPSHSTAPGLTHMVRVRFPGDSLEVPARRARKSTIPNLHSSHHS
ncbi:hypothetical protein PFISCL1PPCAC_2467, partial [Pristionchus fissidentatus]